MFYILYKDESCFHSTPNEERLTIASLPETATYETIYVCVRACVSQLSSNLRIYRNRFLNIIFLPERYTTPHNSKLCAGL